ncbi:MAG: T9SS type A sorting domain-containing protein [Bacteroidota bacterium]
MLLSTLPSTGDRAPIRSRTWRKSLLFFLLLVNFYLLSATLTGQELTRNVVGSAGSYFSAVNVGNIHFTVGEIAVDRTANGLVLERGFHHGIYELLTTSIWSAPAVNLELNVFPNPTADLVNLSGDWEANDRLTITDLLGRQLAEQALPRERAELSIAHYPPGTYVFTITRQGMPIRSMRVIRR